MILLGYICLSQESRGQEYTWPFSVQRLRKRILLTRTNKAGSGGRRERIIFNVYNAMLTRL